MSFACRDQRFTSPKKHPDSLGVDGCSSSSSCKWYIMGKIKNGTGPPKNSEPPALLLSDCRSVMTPLLFTSSVFTSRLSVLHVWQHGKGGTFSPARVFQIAPTALWTGMQEKEMCFRRRPRISSECGKHWRLRFRHKSGLEQIWKRRHLQK